MVNRPDQGDSPAQPPRSTAASWRRDAFASRFVYAATPLAIWAGHFFGAYVFVAIGCQAALDTREFLGIPLLTLGLTALTVAALVWLAIIVVRAALILRSRRRAGFPNGLVAVRLGFAGLSFVAVLWTAPPIALFTSCLQ